MRTEEELIKGIFSDTTGEYIVPQEINPGETGSIRLRVPGGLGRPVGIYLCEATCGTADGAGIHPMEKCSTKGLFSFYKFQWTAGENKLEYYFRLEYTDKTYIYDMMGIAIDREPVPFVLIPGFHTPDWTRGAVYYQIFPDRFCNGSQENDVLDSEYIYIDRHVKSCAWGENIPGDGIGRFYGGDLEGIRSKLDYIKSLGAEAIYLNPIFLSPSNHKYDTQDYGHVDPHLGVIPHDEGELLKPEEKSNTNASRYAIRTTSEDNLRASDELFAELVKEAHEKGLKVILDGVFNHCGSFGRWLDREKIYQKSGSEKGAYGDENSPYKDYFIFQSGKWPDNGDYKCWWDFDTLPKLNYGCKALRDYIISIGTKWVAEPYCCDGWRLDVAADLGGSSEENHQFWQDFRRAVKEANPEAVIMAEHYGDASPWLTGREWDTIMNYDGFMDPVGFFLTGMDKHSRSYSEELVGNTEIFWKSMRGAACKLPASAGQSALIQLSNHDHSRFLTRTTGRIDTGKEADRSLAAEGCNKAVYRAGVMMQMTLPGAPGIYYGDEAGLAGFTDPDNRRCYPWGKEDEKLIAFHREISKLHNGSKALRIGSLIPLPAFRGTLAYGRKYLDEAYIILINTYDVYVEIPVEPWLMGIGDKVVLRRVFDTDEEGWSGSNIHAGKDKKKVYKDNGGTARICIGPKGGAVFSITKRLF